jgi:preprotein translocase subunit SecG
MELQQLETIIFVVHVVAAIAIIGLVLVQHGKGADMGSGFGGGASNTVFGSLGSGNFLTRATTTIAIGFFVTSFVLAYFAKEHSVSARNIGIPAIVQQQKVAEPVVAPQVLSSQPDSEVPNIDETPAEPEIPQG